MSIHLVFPGMLLTLLVPSISTNQVAVLGPKEIDGALKEIEDAAATARKTLKELTNDQRDTAPVIYEGLVGVKRKKRGVIELLGLGGLTSSEVGNELAKREQTVPEDQVQADDGRRKKSKKSKKKKKKKKSKKRKSRKYKRRENSSKKRKHRYGEISYDPKRNKFEFRKIQGYVRPWEKVLARKA